MERFRADPGDGMLTVSARTAIAELTDVLTEHLGHEERDMEPISAANHAAPQIKAAQKAVRQAHRGNPGRCSPGCSTVRTRWTSAACVAKSHAPSSRSSRGPVAGGIAAPFLPSGLE